MQWPTCCGAQGDAQNSSCGTVATTFEGSSSKDTLWLCMSNSKQGLAGSLRNHQLDVSDPDML